MKESERIKFLRSIYDSYRNEPAIQMDIRIEIRKLSKKK